MSRPPVSLPPARIGYCTNVHAGTDLATIREKLQTYAGAIARSRLHRDTQSGPLGVGLWIPASAAAELIRTDAAEAFARWLGEQHLFPLTVNGFPYDNFHLPVVKHRVYRPAWWESARLEYTVQLAKLLDRMLPADGSVGSISTLPLGWPGALGRGDAAEAAADEAASAAIDAANVARAGANLRTLAAELQRLEQQTGRRIVVAIEPEPGCMLDRCGDVVRFFDSELPDANHRRYLTVCHDVCHSAVMFESQSEALATYRRAGIAVGKVQISSAIDVPLAEYTPEQRAAAIEQLSQFAEDRYLHQTGVLDASGQLRLVEDLPQWLATAAGGADAADEHLRIHFHVPVFRTALGQLRSTQQAIQECVTAMQSADAPEFTGHYEVETYAWTVLPETVTSESMAAAGELTGLAAGISRELDWFESLLHTIAPTTLDPTGPLTHD